MKQYIGISRDHSGSMFSLANAAMGDYNESIQAVKDASGVNNIDTIVSVVRHEGRIVREVVNSNVSQLKPLAKYTTPGNSTPLFDSVAELITLLQNAPDARDPEVSFLVMAITDGQDNSSRISGKALGQTISQLQSTDRWTFVFRVPHGYKYELQRMGIPEGNIQEWDQTVQGLREATVVTQSAISNYYGNVSRGIRSTTSFYSDLSGVSSNQVTATMADISKDVNIYPVPQRSGIESFIALKTKKEYVTGTAFYQLTKTEKAVQRYKLIVVRNKNTGKVYAGQHARDLLGLPTDRTIRLIPGDHGQWDIYIQSTSRNRILLPGTTVMYWKDAVNR